ncbi:MAG TPA: hypothetical protein VGZ26_10035 [Pirellulales bacterium]|nr:hypothetical protein [Pirellulales bacterium]
MEKARFQFTIKRVMLAVFCAGACFGSLAILASGQRDGSWHDHAYMGLTLLAVEMPFVGIGILFRCLKVAILFGFVAWLFIGPAIMVPYH